MQYNTAFAKGPWMIEMISSQNIAEHYGLQDGYFRWLCKCGNGPEAIRPSPKQVFFQREALDAWIETWNRKSTARQYQVGITDHTNRLMGA